MLVRQVIVRNPLRKASPPTVLPGYHCPLGREFDSLVGISQLTVSWASARFLRVYSLKCPVAEGICAVGSWLFISALPRQAYFNRSLSLWSGKS